MKKLKQFREECISLLEGKPIKKKDFEKGLPKEGWVSTYGKEHDRWDHPKMPGKSLIIPRHKELSPGVHHQLSKIRSAAMAGA